MDLELVEKQRLYEGKKISLEVHHLQDGNGHRVRREVVVHPGAVVVLPFLSTDRILLIRNRRYAAGQTLVELPAGTLDKKEDPMNCAGRELQEETGYLAGRLQRLGGFYSSPGVLSEKLYAFAAYDLQRTATALEDDEEIEVMETSFDEAIEMIRQGQIIDAKTIATLLMYERFNRDVLRGIK
ncbi:MAG: NUDIX hydrolase [Phycisphaerales bacterium]|nr:NUDIX hydrolase [Phycisphaerales bacterium]